MTSPGKFISEIYAQLREITRNYTHTPVITRKLLVQVSRVTSGKFYIISYQFMYRKPSLNLPWATISSPPELSRKLAPIGYY